MESKIFIQLKKLWEVIDALQETEKFLLEQWQQELQKVEQIKK